MIQKILLQNFVLVFIFSTHNNQELITKKIEELKCPGDEEFAEYIIVMLHNDKTAAEVQSELEPFLGKQSAVFTPWFVC